jgi:hypothetical protein
MSHDHDVCDCDHCRPGRLLGCPASFQRLRHGCVKIRSSFGHNSGSHLVLDWELIDLYHHRRCLRPSVLCGFSPRQVLAISCCPVDLCICTQDGRGEGIIEEAVPVPAGTIKNAAYIGISAHDADDGTVQMEDTDTTVALDEHVVEAFEIDDDTIELQQEFEPFPRWHVLVSFPLIVFFYLIGLDVTTICLCAAAVQMGCFSWRSHQFDGEQRPSPLTKFDYGLLINVTAQLLLTASWNDTGLTDDLAMIFLGDQCADQPTSFDCLHRFVPMIILLCITFSSMNANLMILAYMPYSSPYEWMQVTLISSLIGNLAGSPFFDRPQPSSWATYYMFTIPTAILSIFVGVFILQHWHVSYECSKRLGESCR